MADAEGAKISPVGVLCFPDIFEPVQPTDDDGNPRGKPRYQFILVFDEKAQATPEFAAMKQDAKRALDKKFPGDSKPPVLRSPFRSCTEKAGKSGFEDPKGIFISFWTERKPEIIDGYLNDVVPSDVYPGVGARCTYNAFGYSARGNNGVAFGFDGLQIVDFDRPRVDGRTSAKKAFGTVEGASAAPDGATGGSSEDDDMPF